ncbi:ABC transporter ATP-binding protein [Lactococcus raffinolactis]|uniref:ABC transporter ATP-binding protein n=1 Tax=Pseudolactococcus raffinolactis TaxID=1366 RepID=UPI001C2062A1|nr:ABC transporter ATP-binding protein [Lactococcus raffinolactis]
MSIELSITLLFLLPLTLFIFIPLGNILAKLSFKNQSNLGKLNQFSNFITINSDFIKDNISQNFELKKGKKIVKELKEISIKEAKYMSFITPILSIILMITILVILAFGFYLTSIKKLSIGSLVAYILLTIEIINPVTSLGSNIASLKILKGSTLRIENLFKTMQIEKLKTKIKPIDFKMIEFNNVSFSYPSCRQKMVLKNISLQINSGETIAIVGPNGSGKSSILRLLSGKYKEYSGEILLNKKNISEYDVQDIRANTSFVSQTNILFSGTIRNNLLYGINKEIPDFEILNICKLTGLDKAISRFQNGLDFEINAGESNLSEGEKQKISITRALLKNSSLFLLDEVTSALDAESEQNIIKVLKKYSELKCTIMIAHRLSTIEKVDKIFFLENGMITGIGNHTDLFDNHDRYKQYVLYQLNK